mgnify:CR=1 FL=1
MEQGRFEPECARNASFEKLPSVSESHMSEGRRHINIPIFLPQYGCRHRCVYCSQEKITGKKGPKPGEIADEIRKILATVGRVGTDIEIAFFGGSFTALPRQEMTAYLETAAVFVRAGEADGIRLSTRPDAIDGEILDILKDYGVGTIELGIQSMSDSVLERCGRGHTAEDTRRACRAITGRGFALVGQMMTGLPGSSAEDEKLTAAEIAAMGASAARIYPTVVFEGTLLAGMMRSGVYIPPSYEESVMRAAGALRIFADRGIPVIRIGLCESESLHTSGGIVAGAYVPSMGEEIRSEVWFSLADEALSAAQLPKDSPVTLCVPKGAVSQMTGRGRGILRRLENRYSLAKIHVRGEDISPWHLTLAVESAAAADPASS